MLSYFPLQQNMEYISLLLAIIAVSLGCCDRTSDKIYYDLTSKNACFRRLNATHQIGCSSSRKGSVGVLHYIQVTDNLTWLVENGPHEPYVILLEADMFLRDVVDKLKNSKKINGIMIINNQTEPPSNFSPDDSCPNQNFELYKEDETYGHCAYNSWNPSGQEFLSEDFDFPIVTITNWTRIDFLINECYEKFNRPIDGSARSYPLCGAQVRVAMDAVKDTPTCLHRGKPRNFNPQTFCDPLGDYNVYSFLRPIEYANNQSFVDTLENSSVIIAAAKLDTAGLFDGMFTATEQTVVGFISLLAAAQALGGNVRDSFQDTDKPIMFSFFQGESYDYIGSTRMLYDMAHGSFPYSVHNGSEGPHPIRPQHVHSMLEVSQLALPEENKFWIHSDPLSRQIPAVDQDVINIESIMAAHGKEVGLEVLPTENDLPLPPASLQTFLKNITIPGVVLTDHNARFNNRYYSSRYDTPSSVGYEFDNSTSMNESQFLVTPLAQQLTDVATVIARTLYELSTGHNYTEGTIEADNVTVAQLLFCFFVTPQCDLFNFTVKESDSRSLPADPYPFYVSIDRVANPVTSHTIRLLAYFTGKQVNKTEKDCDAAEHPYYQYIWMQGPVNYSDPDLSRIGICIETTVNKSVAVSPAFLDGYDWSTNLYPAWTESVWPSDSPSVRVFLLPDRNYEIFTLCIGLGVFLVSAVLVFFCSRKSDVLFEMGFPVENSY